MLKSTYEIPGETAVFDDFVFGLTNYKDYKKMQKLSISSFKENLLGEWSLIHLTGTKDTLQESFIFTLEKTYKIWKNEKCNILYTDPDTLCIKPTQVFNEDFVAGCRHNCGVRYFPHDMDSSIWDQVFEHVSKWNYNKYDYEQDIYISMYRSGKAITDIVQQAPIYEKFTGIDYSKNIIHLHSSGGPKKTLMKMRELNKNMRA
jgi:hypothetical protein